MIMVPLMMKTLSLCSASIRHSSSRLPALSKMEAGKVGGWSAGVQTHLAAGRSGADSDVMWRRPWGRREVQAEAGGALPHVEWQGDYQLCAFSRLRGRIKITAPPAAGERSIRTGGPTWRWSRSLSAAGGRVTASIKAKWASNYLHFPNGNRHQEEKLLTTETPAGGGRCPAVVRLTPVFCSEELCVCKQT